MADKAITWMNRHLAMNPDRPFLMWWTPGAVHGPHHVAKKWAEKYEGKFDKGWDAVRERRLELSDELDRIFDRALMDPEEVRVAFDGIGFRGQAKTMTQKQCGAGDGSTRISYIQTRDIGCRAVDRLEHRGPIRSGVP